MSNKQKDMMHSLGYITADEIAAKIGRTEVTIYQWAEAGKIASKRIGRSIYIERKSLIAYLGADNAKLFGLV